MQRLKVEFTKQGRARFISHLDLMRAWERALRRARVPVALSEGFNPHPRMSFASALAVGVASEREYLEMDLKTEVMPVQVAELLDGALPEGLKILSITPLKPDGPPLMALVEAAGYRAEVPVALEADPYQVNAELERFLRLPQIQIVRVTKHGPKEIDLRPGILSLEGRIEAGKLTLTMLLANGKNGTVRPEEVVQTFVRTANWPADLEKLRMTRSGLFKSQGNVLVEL